MAKQWAKLVSLWTARLAVGALAGMALNVQLLAARPIPLSPEFHNEDSEVSLEPVQRGAVSLQEAVRRATQRYEGRVVRAATVESSGRRVHEIRILLTDGGRVVTVRVDAETGAMR